MHPVLARRPLACDKWDMGGRNPSLPRLMRLIPTAITAGALAATVGFSPGCGDAATSTCVPGETRSCPCPGGTMSAQTCQDDGTFEACACDIDAGGMDAGSDDAGSSDGGDEDAGPMDGGPMDAGADSGPDDGGRADADAMDAATEDGATADAAPGDSGSDAGPEPCTDGCSVVQLAGGFAHTCALRQNGNVWCWGSNAEGELGDDRMHHSDECTPPGSTEVLDCSAVPRQVVGLPGPVAQISAKSGRSTCARTEDDEVYCWGREALVDPGSGDFERRFSAERVADFSGAVDVSDAQSFTCAVMDDATVHCLGRNDGGQLGDGTDADRSTAASVTGLSGATDVEVAADFGEFACAITSSDVQCWGGNQFRQLGDDVSVHTECGDLDDARDCSLEPVTVVGLPPPEELALGIDHACARESDGSIFCWGRNSSRQLAMDVTGPVATPTAVDAVADVEQLAAGGFHTCARLTDGSVKCWGANDEGQLGDGTRDHGESCGIGGTTGDCSATPVDVALPDSPATTIAAGRKQNCAALESGEVWCWGWNDRRQVGIDDRSPQPTPVQVVLP